MKNESKFTMAVKVIYYLLIALAVALGIIVAISTIARAGTSKTVYQRNKEAAHEAAELMRSYGYSESNPIIVAAGLWWREQDELEQNEDSFVSNDKMKEYPVASTVWNELRKAGYSNAVCAGILGNMMSECGGQSLDLDPYIETFGYYGLCMWFVDYTPQIKDRSVYGQIDVLLETIEENMKLFGGDYSYFLSITDAQEAAWYFAFYYERCLWDSVRSRNAQTALNYYGEWK